MATPLSFRAPYTLAVHRGKVLCASAELGVKIISVYPVNYPKMVLLCLLPGQTVSADYDKNICKHAILDRLTT